ncbi:hypothetical protein [Methanobrevibacter ruminantium]|uniref:hypothetical protein n=1 Tax=Methanobrevibacter ruminantium TaxID=83816 RepID=UPI003F087199
MENLYKNLPEIKVFIPNEGIFNDINNSFKYSISLNPLLEKEIFNIYKRTLLNSGKLTLNIFHLKYLELFENLVKENNNSEDLFELSDSLIKIIDLYFEKLDNNLFIQSPKDLEKLKNILEISLILMEGSVDNLDIELAYESFFQVERRIEKEKLYKKSLEIIKNIEPYKVSVVVTMNDNIVNSSKEMKTPLNV